MKNINTKSIVFSSGMLAIFAFGLFSLPAQTNAQATPYITPYHFENTRVNNNVTISEPLVVNNPKPSVDSINPSSAERSVNAKTITVSGSGFIPSSVARLNGSNRSTTFIDEAHLLVQLTPNDMYSTDGFFITVFNGLPGGGYSNAAFFTINNVATPAMNTNGNNPSVNTENNANNNFFGTGTNQTENGTGNEVNNKYGDLASGVIFGSGSFMPSGLIQWVIVAMIILLIVIIARRAFGARENYDALPMKYS